MSFSKESDFEEALISTLSQCGWESEVLQHPTEQDLLENWKDILFDNNRGIDRLNDCPLTDGEMGQIMEQIRALRTPLKLNSFINGKTVSIKRDNPDDVAHLGKEVSLKIYDRGEIAAGQSRYQIVQQPIFNKQNALLNDRRGDLMLLINGMPVFHIELKRSGVPISQACNQIAKYAFEKHFTGLFSLVQIFVAMSPEECLYFANPGPDGQFKREYYFQWADFNNEPITDWQQIAKSFLSIPMAHQLIGFYTVADNADGVLKVMRSYQYYAANAISDKVSKKGDSKSQLGGYVWHTTGSGKTMTSFKSAQLIARSQDADKVVFLMDRVELGTQSLKEYRGFADADESVQATESTKVLIAKLKSKDPADTLIVSSIQKMSNIKVGNDGLHEDELAKMNCKRVVFVVDEAHRSTFGDMLKDIKKSFPTALFFGFTGTPVLDVNNREDETTLSIFGSELHRYSIADGIRDKNVLGFDPDMVLTYRDRDLREAIALQKARAATLDEIWDNPDKLAIYQRYMDGSRVRMAGYQDEDGKEHKGIEDELPTAQYACPKHRLAVVQDIKEHWRRLSANGKFHAIFATSSIPEAIAYYRLFKQEMPELKQTCLVDSTIDNKDGFVFKSEGLQEVFSDYNERYGQSYSLADAAKFKLDVSLRLAHKGHYRAVDHNPEQQLDLLVVVDQMLTGFDSKWVNTLYLDKMLEYQNLIQAFSRTNRLFGPEKPFGMIRYYRKPHTMRRRIEDALKLYSGDRPFALFVDKLDVQLTKLNATHAALQELFAAEKIQGFTELPEEPSACKKFAKLFAQLNKQLRAAEMQGFTWEKREYRFKAESQESDVMPLAYPSVHAYAYTEEEDGLLAGECCDDEEQEGEQYTVSVTMSQQDYLALALRYKELANEQPKKNPDPEPKEPSSRAVAYDIDTYLTEIDTSPIDADYMNSRFEKYLKALRVEGNAQQSIDKALSDLLKCFATLTKEEQKFASIFIHDIEHGLVEAEEGKTLRDYITERMVQSQNDSISQFAQDFGLDESQLRDILSQGLKETKDIYAAPSFELLVSSADKAKVRAYVSAETGKPLKPFEVTMAIRTRLAQFIESYRH